MTKPCQRHGFTITALKHHPSESLLETNDSQRHEAEKEHLSLIEVAVISTCNKNMNDYMFMVQFKG